MQQNITIFEEICKVLYIDLYATKHYNIHTIQTKRGTK